MRVPFLRGEVGLVCEERQWLCDIWNIPPVSRQGQMFLRHEERVLDRRWDATWGEGWMIEQLRWRETVCDDLFFVLIHVWRTYASAVLPGEANRAC